MTAKKMFEELGFEIEDHGQLSLHYEKKTPLNKYQWITYDIIFDLVHKTIEIYGEDKSYQSFKIFQAINKQIEELGWNNE